MVSFGLRASNDSESATFLLKGKLRMRLQVEPEARSQRVARSYFPLEYQIDPGDW